MNQQNRIPIGRINDAEIFAVSDPSGETFVPIKPICQALGIDFAAQYNKVKEDISFSPTIAIIAMVGADDKERDMVCLPIRRVYGWLYTINPGKVAPEAKEQVVKYRDICNDILYAHFSGRSGKMRELDSAEREAVARIEKLDKALKDAQQVVAGIKNEKAQASDTLEKIRAARLDDAPSLFDWIPGYSPVTTLRVATGAVGRNYDLSSTISLREIVEADGKHTSVGGLSTSTESTENI